jgi:predicted Rossmann fold nucleotide-binding protein DprA/Smf involved in DNA uptake
MRTGRMLVSGGAVGADSVALDAALACGGSSRCVEVLPFGLDHAPVRDGVCQLSVCEPWAPFSTGQAMERNALIYSFGRRTVVVRARLRAGGTWHGAADALRRRLGDVYVRTRRGDDAAAALCAIGALGVAGVAALPALLERPVVQAQPGLFGSSAVRSAAASFG